MNASWKNTYEALTNLSSILECYKCKKKPENAMRYTHCDHFFCKQCAENDTVCTVCKTPAELPQIFNDDLVDNLVSCCSKIQEIMQEKNTWDTRIQSNEIPSATRTSNRSNLININYYIPKKNINKLNAKGETRLHNACAKNKGPYVEALLVSGANPNTKDYSGWTPLQEAVSYGYTDICQLLLEHGASPNTPGAGNRSALHDAIINNRLSEVKLLLLHAANKNVYDDKGKTPIDYCKPHSEIWSILRAENQVYNQAEATIDMNNTLNQSLPALHSFDPFVIYVSKLTEKNKEYLSEMALKHKIKVVSIFGPSVTHLIMEASNENVVQLSYDVMMALLRGTWILNTEWMQLHIDLIDVVKGDVELFEISGAPIKGIPKKARENAQNGNPGLFNHCYFYFALQPKHTYYINDMKLTREALINLVRAGDGMILTREPNPEDINPGEQRVPYHVASEPRHALYKCTHFIIYVPGKDEPRVKYNMPHMKTLPLMWLIECIEKFTLTDPIELGLLKF